MFNLSLFLSCASKVTLVVFADVFEELYIFVVKIDPFRSSLIRALYFKHSLKIMIIYLIYDIASKYDAYDMFNILLMYLKGFEFYRDILRNFDNSSYFAMFHCVHSTLHHQMRKTNL